MPDWKPDIRAQARRRPSLTPGVPTGHWLSGLRQDVSYAVRTLRKSPGFTAVAILSLAVGIGATTTIFTFVNAVFLRPLPYPGSDRLVVLHEHQRTGSEPLNVHPGNFVEWRRRARAFDALALVQAPPLNVMGSRGAEQVSRLLATEDIFRVFGVAPVLGRGFTPDDTRPGSGKVVVLGHGFWQRWFGGDPGVLGRQLLVQDGSLTILGVAPPGLRVGSIEPDVFTPLAIDPANPAATGSRSFQCYGRLAAGVGLDTARAEMDVIASALERESAFAKGMGVFVSDLQEYLGREARPGLRLLMGVVITVLAIACVNLAGLLMARGFARRGELAVRASLGASRGRLVRQLVVESLVLSLSGGIVGLAFADAATRALTTLAAGALTAGVPGRCSAGRRESVLHDSRVSGDRPDLRAAPGAGSEPDRSSHSDAPADAIRHFRSPPSPHQERPRRHRGGVGRGAPRRCRPALSDVLQPVAGRSGVPASRNGHGWSVSRPATSRHTRRRSRPDPRPCRESPRREGGRYHPVPAAPRSHLRHRFLE